ncbi:MAG: creatininase family protein [Verrucomicrobiales bacterium]|nr:creatininase family protein [Verrucomicrobiales bacterium]
MESTIQLENLPWPEVEKIRDEVDGFLVLPIGATEQHGPHLPINCDTVIARALSHAACAKAGIPVLPAIAYTVSSGHTNKWTGTFSLTHETFIHQIEEIADWAVATGWKKILLVNSHFGNDSSLRVAIEKIRLRFFGKLQIGLKHTFQVSDEVWSYFISDAEDLHANKAETDLLLYLTPDLVRMDLVEDDPDRTGGTVFSYPVAQTSLNGLTGSPSLGTATRGESLFQEMTDALAAFIESAKTESAPLESHHWENLNLPST